MMGLNKDVSKEDFEKGARTYLVFKEMVESNNYDGLAIECWPRFYQQLHLVLFMLLGF